MLCGYELPVHPINDEGKRFCCAGCHAVFSILSAKNQLSQYQDTPVFRQAVQAGLISNPELLEHIERKRDLLKEEELQKFHLEVGDMWCPACAEVIRLVLLQMKGVHTCVVDYATDLASVEFAPRYISKDRILEAIAAFGYRPVPLNEVSGKGVSRSLAIRFIIAAFFALNAMMFAYPLYATYFDVDGENYASWFTWLSFFSAIPVVSYCAWPIFRRCFTGLRVGIVGMEALVTLGVLTAFGVSTYNLIVGSTKVYYDSLTVIIAFVLLGKIIEAKAKVTAKEALVKLSRALPRKARKRMPDGSYAFVLLKEIVCGDILEVFSGERISVDGKVCHGSGFCDESLMTGEAIPVAKAEGSSVLAGTILQRGQLSVKVDQLPETSSLHKIIDMIQQGITSKSAQQMRPVDQIVTWFVPIVTCIALGSLFWCWWRGYSLEIATIRALSVLLISCPCAIGIAVPLAEAYLMQGLASLGIIVRNRACLPFFGQETAIVFDKTGTVTEGAFRVLSGLESLSPLQRGKLKAMCLKSNHLIPIAIARSIEENVVPFDTIEEIAGHGLRGCMGQESFLLGSDTFLRLNGVTVPSADVEGTPVYFAYNGQCISCITLGDRIRDTIPGLLRDLMPARTILLSGDDKKAVEVVAKVCGFEEFHWRTNPLEKRQFIEDLRKRGEIVCMIGDGTNDAPALTMAQVGVSVVSANDISIQVSDLLMTTDRIQVLFKGRKLARKGHRIARQNLFWAFIYNGFGIGLAATGNLTPVFAAFAMVASSLMVLLNAHRIKGQQGQQGQQVF